jgi:nitrile hydratase
VVSRAELDLGRALPPPGPSSARAPRGGALRTIVAAPRFALGQQVRARNLNPPGHTRLPRYARGKRGTIARVHPAWVFPDTNAHGLGEQPQYVYAVRFDAHELWGDDAEPGTCILVDLFESYLEPEGVEPPGRQGRQARKRAT